MASPETVYADATDETYGTQASEVNPILYAWVIPDSSASSVALIYFNVFDAAGGPVPDDATVTAASFWVYSIAYSYGGTKPSQDPHGSVWICDDGSSSYTEFADWIIYPGDGWQEYALSQAAYEAIGVGDSVLGPGYDTEIKCLCDTPGGTASFRKWELAAFENTGGGSEGDWAAYLVVTYTEAATGFAHSVIVSC